MSDDNSNVSNKNAGKGNGNSIINDTSTNDNTNNYTSPDAFPTSTGHKFGTSNVKKDEEAE
ncbi:hypothetical protein [Anaerosporobacter sp.]